MLVEAQDSSRLCPKEDEFASRLRAEDTDMRVEKQTRRPLIGTMSHDESVRARERERVVTRKNTGDTIDCKYSPGEKVLLLVSAAKPIKTGKHLEGTRASTPLLFR